MATKAKLTPDEMWLQKTFGTDLEKLDDADKDGGKDRKQFLKDLEVLKANCEYMKVMIPIALKVKVKEDDQPAKQKLADETAKLLAKITPFAKKGDVKHARDAALDAYGSMQKLLAKADRSGSEIGGNSGENFRRVAGKILF